jgi:hypothetical protein
VNEWDETAFVYSKRSGTTYMENNVEERSQRMDNQPFLSLHRDLVDLHFNQYPDRRPSKS